jgi:hypothetical protein
MTTLDNVIAHLESIAHVKLKRDKSGYRGNSPFRNDSNSRGFSIYDIRSDGEAATYKDHPANESGTLYALANKLGVEIVGNRHEVADTKRSYQGLADYAQAHGVTADKLTEMGWEQVTYQGRDAIKFPVAKDIYRYRFLDDGKPRYINESGYVRVWYGLGHAIEYANENNLDYIVLCNGEISTVSGKCHGLPAFAMAGGESSIPDDLLESLNAAWHKTIITALDCDKTGRDAAKAIKAQLPNAKIVQMPLTENGDLADFCMLHQDQSLTELARLVDAQNPTVAQNPHETDAQSSDAAAQTVKEQIYGEIDTNVRTFKNPLKSLHQFGGFNRICVTGKVTLIIGGTGTGKTQLVETITDKLNRDGYNGGWNGEEWTKEEMHMRRIQRYSHDPHITYEDIQLHNIWVANHKRGIHPDDNDGVKFTPEQYIAFNRANDFIINFDGKMDYAERHTSIDDVFDDMHTYIDRMQREDKEVDFMVFDYVQLLRASSPEKSINRFEYAFEQCKKFSADKNVHVYMPSQANKLSQDIAASGGSLGLQDAHYIRADKANGVYALNRVLVKNGDEYIETPCFWLNIVKASLGKKGRVPLLMDSSHLVFKETYRASGGDTLIDWTRDETYEHVMGNIFYQGNNSTRVENIPF